jgi:hypothetical protein
MVDTGSGPAERMAPASGCQHRRTQIHVQARVAESADERQSGTRAPGIHPPGEDEERRTALRMRLTTTLAVGAPTDVLPAEDHGRSTLVQ